MSNDLEFAVMLSKLERFATPPPFILPPAVISIFPPCVLIVPAPMLIFPLPNPMLPPLVLKVVPS